MGGVCCHFLEWVLLGVFGGEEIAQVHIGSGYERSGQIGCLSRVSYN